MGLLERLGFPTGRAAKIIDGHHAGQAHESGTSPKPDMLPLPEEEERQRPHGKRDILVAVSGKDLDTELVTLACNLAKSKHVNAYVIYGIEVPRKLPIDAELPDQTQAASEALERAASVAEQLGMHIDPEIVQSRHFGQSLADEADARDCALLILGLPYRVGLGGNFELGETAEYVLKNAPCKVWLVRGQRPEEAERISKADRPEGVGSIR